MTPQLPLGINRRRFISACSELGFSALTVPWVTRAENPKALVAEVKTISTQPEYYNGCQRWRDAKTATCGSHGREVVSFTFVLSDRYR